MTGPEHYLKAEELLEGAHAELQNVDDPDGAAILTGLAQVHATLALAPASSAELTDATEQVHNVLATWRGQSDRVRLSVELMDALDVLRVAVEGK